MAIFQEFLVKIENQQHRTRMTEILAWISQKFPSLVPRMAWNHPMFTDHGTYIVGFSTARQHWAIATEVDGINHFSPDIKRAGYDHTVGLMRIKWDQAVDDALLEKMIAYNIKEKDDCTSFWRKDQ
jgi:uncharacterized protein